MLRLYWKHVIWSSLEPWFVSWMLQALFFSPLSILYPLQVSILFQNFPRLAISLIFSSELQIRAGLNARWHSAKAQWIFLNLFGRQVCLGELSAGSKTMCQNPSSRLFLCISLLEISHLIGLRSRGQEILEMTGTEHFFDCLGMNLLQPQSHFWSGHNWKQSWLEITYSLS